MIELANVDDMDLTTVRNFYKAKSIEDNVYYLMGSKYADEVFSDPRISEDGITYFRNLFEEYDDYGSIPLELGNDIEQMLDDSTIVLGIHRTGGMGTIDKDNIVGSQMLHSIFSEGLKNMGHLSSGHDSNIIPDPSQTVSMIGSIVHAVMSIKGQYKDSVGGVLVALPSSCVNKDGEIINNSYETIYTMVDNTHAVKSEYLLGFVASDNGVCTYYPKECFTKGKSL